MYYLDGYEVVETEQRIRTTKELDTFCALKELSVMCVKADT